MAGTLKASVSGIRGIVGDSLTPPMLLSWIGAYARWLGKGTVAVGRDTRKSGPLVERLAEGALLAHGIDVVSLGIVPTPTLLFTVREQQYAGGILITASHNPIEWNALKLVKRGGLFLNQADFTAMSARLDQPPAYETVHGIGTYSVDAGALARQVDAYVKRFDVRSIRNRKFKVAIDPGGGAGAVLDRDFLQRLGCDVVGVHEAITGDFPRPPEPRPDALGDLAALVKASGAVVGFAQDPDADRLCLVDETGRPVSEELTLALATQAFYARKNTGDVVVNVSTSRVVADVAGKSLATTFLSRVGEANVLDEMQKRNAPFGGEGNGGVIYPRLNACRDSFVGMLLVLDLLARTRKPLSVLVAALPRYAMVKEKVDIKPPADLADRVRRALKHTNLKFKETTIDGLRLDCADGWVHVRESNTEPVVRIISEARDAALAQGWVDAIRAVLVAD